MDKNNLDSNVASDELRVLDSFKSAFAGYKENFNFLAFVYLPIAVLSVLGIFVPGILGGVFMFASGVLTAFSIPGFISAISKKFYPEIATPGGKTKALYSDGAKYILSVFWIGILTALCVLFGTFAFVVPGIWLGVVLGYSTYALIFDGRRGVEALAYSYIYAKNNFWFIAKRLLVLGLGMIIVGSIISSIFPPEKVLVSEIVGDEYTALPAELKNSEMLKKIFGDEEPFVMLRQPGDQALSAIFNNIFLGPFVVFFAVGIFGAIKRKNALLVTDEEVKKTKTKIKLFVWLGVFLPIAIIAGLVAIFGEAALSSLREILP